MALDVVEKSYNLDREGILAYQQKAAELSKHQCIKHAVYWVGDGGYYAIVKEMKMVKITNTRSSSPDAEPVEEAPTIPEASDENGLISLGKGMYQLTDGSEVKGKKNAIEAAKALSDNAE